MMPSCLAVFFLESLSASHLNCSRPRAADGDIVSDETTITGCEPVQGEHLRPRKMSQSPGSERSPVRPGQPGLRRVHYLFAVFSGLGSQYFRAISA
jgi:hypothetical protein